MNQEAVRSFQEKEVPRLRPLARAPLMLTGVIPRLRGLTAKSARESEFVLLAPCRDIHTFGMKECIDVAFFGADGRALMVFLGVAPHRRLYHPKARMVAERIASAAPWFRVGDTVLALPGNGQRMTLAQKQRQRRTAAATTTQGA